MKNLFNFNIRSIVLGKARWLLTFIAILTLGVGQMWADNYIEGDAGLITTGWSKTGYRIDNTPYNNYAVAAGKYNFKITDGYTESGSSCFGTVTGITSSSYGVTDGCMWINLSGINDVNITWANNGWNVNITVTPSSYFIKYPWGDNHAWTFSAPMTACADGTYACTGPYNGTTYDFGRRGNDGGAGALTAQTATVNNTPSTDETCVFSVTTAGALTITRCNKVAATNKIYFDNSVSNFTGNIYLIIGHDKPTKYSCAYKMTQLTGTKLYYVSVGATWSDATYYAIVGNSAASISEGSWGSESLSSKQTGGYTAAYTGKYDLDGSNKQYVFKTTSSGNGQALTIDYKNTSYSNINYAQAVTLCTKAYGASSYSANTSSLTSLNFTTYNLTAVGTVSTQQTNNMNGSTGIASGNACQAATTVINVGDAPASWVYDGIFTSMTGAGSAVSTDQEFTYYPTAATNYYVRFHEVHDPSVSLAASSSYLTTTSGLRALKGETITLTATALYNVNTLVYTYEYSTNGGSTWNTIASRSASSTQTYTASSTGDYIFRVTLPDEAGTVNGTTNVHMTQMYTINVKKNSSWTPNKLYIWNKSTEIMQYGEFPGATDKFTNKGQWYSFELNSDFDSFVISASSHATNHTADVNNVSADGCYTIGGTTGTSCPVSSGASCPSVPSVTTGSASSLTNTSATFNATGVSANNDAITAYGFKWGTTTACSNTQAASNLSSTTFSFNKTSLTAGNTIYFKAYATNGQGTTEGDRLSFVVPYKVTVSKGTGCTSITNSGTNYTSSSITVTATKTDGYTFSSWSTTNGTQTSTSSTTTTNTLVFTPTSDNATISPTYTENMTAVTLAHTGNGHIQIGAATVTETTAGVATTRTIVAVPDAGYYFAGWTVADGADCSVASTAGRNDNESSSTTLRGLGAGTTGTVTANFVENEKIYFRNIFTDGSTTTRWSNVYVYYGITWEDGRAVSNTSSAYKVAMTRILGTDVYWAYVPRSFTTHADAALKKQVAFSDASYGTSFKFYHATASHDKAATRGDYNKALNMFVPYHTAKSINTGNGGVDYFDNGYWMKYDTKASQGAGYYLKVYNSRNSYTQKGEFMANTDDATVIQFKLRIDNTNDTYNKYMIVSAGGLNYVTDATVTSSAYADVVMSENTKTLSDNDVYFQLKATSEGYYTFIIDQTGDKMKLTIDYPVSPDDYRLKHTYVGKKKTDPAVDSTYITYSDIIKSATASETRRMSMYLNSGGTETLVLQKCTGINGTTKLPEWNTGDSDNLSDILTKLGTDGNGVYQFDLAVNTSTHKVSTVDSIRLYTGNYYIKTDAASGGWVNYTRNIMDKNTVNFDRTSATFDNYWCNYFESQDWNIKCVIANDYCNQLSDTLKSDAIARVEAGEPYVPVDGTSIRFSYNSATNTIDRAYLGASLNNDFLNIYPSTGGKIYRTISSTDYDLYTYRTSDKSKTKFGDNGNWVYEMDLKVKPGGKAGVIATYTDASSVAHVQTLLADTNTVLGGTGSKTYDISVVYDFKTNYLMSAFTLPGEAITEELKNVDMLWIRHKDESPQQLTFTGSGALTNVSVVGAIELRYNELNHNSTDPSNVSLTSWTPTNRPYLKYFISFPFDVPVNSVFGLNQAQLGREYVIQKYNGALRAKEGLFAGDDDNYWENLTKDSIMHANEGYCVIFDNDYASGLLGHIWDNKSAGSSVYLYFPANSTIASITNIDAQTTVKSLPCEVDRTWAGNSGKNHKETDSHWHMIGSPLFHDSYIKSKTEVDTFQLRSYYKLDYSDNKWKPQAITLGTTQFKAMSSVLVQWHGTITWTTAAGPYAAPVRKGAPMKNYLVQLDLSYNGETPDWTYVQLQDGANDNFILREDMCKFYNKGIPQIYTYAGAYDVAYNGVPVKNQTIPVGVVIRKNGTYTFSMPTNFCGTVTLIDTFAQTRTNLAFDDYEVTLQKGTIDDRFLLEIDINNAATAIDGAENGEGSLKDGKAHKFIQNGTMYILRDGVIYDAQGKKVE